MYVNKVMRAEAQYLVVCKGKEGGGGEKKIKMINMDSISYELSSRALFLMMRAEAQYLVVCKEKGKGGRRKEKIFIVKSIVCKLILKASRNACEISYVCLSSLTHAGNPEEYIDGGVRRGGGGDITRRVC